MNTLASLLLMALTLSSQAAAPDARSCVERRGVFDVGSGATKILVSDVDHCKSMIKSVVLLRVSRKVSYSKDLSRAGSDGALSSEVQTLGLDVLRELKAEAEKLEPRPARYAGIATEAFRKATNGPVFMRRIHDAIGVGVRIIPQDEEALLGFRAATRIAVTPSGKSVTVWDIGGGSMQLTVGEAGKAPRVLTNAHASETFREAVIRDVKKLDPGKQETPNPLTPEEQVAATRLSRKLAEKWLKESRVQHPGRGTRILAIGGVLRDSILGQVRKLKKNDKLEEFDQADIRAVLKARVGQSDDQLREATGTEYFRTEVTNLALVLGFMEALGIERAQVVAASVADGVAISNGYWKD